MSTPFLGQISIFSGNFAPRGWSMCAGQLLSIAQNTALFSLLGTFYGGDGRTTFALPDLRGRIPMNQGQGPGLTNRSIGERAGIENVTLISTEMPMHNHSLNASSQPANKIDISATALPGTLTDPDHFYTVNDGTTPAPTIQIMSPSSCGIDGGSQPHNNMMPTLTITYIIALQGIFPSRN